jgi:hypothetical protein
MDHGIANPCAWHIAATDEQGNIVVFDSYYAPGNISEHVAVSSRSARRGGRRTPTPTDGS